jgi:predicted dinucleotide-binding enzyme
VTDAPHFKRLALIGFGLIGGSIARAARAQGLVSEIVTSSALSIAWSRPMSRPSWTPIS